ncbi:PREDICTED: CD83 antigen isoform X2 [Cyprinodon variegatus]|uniref:CD83 antigen isoform X2 n=1 Tax=Cyprinodon variegatus TaxID=28743 RepID=UPI000742B44B|nr:PREDICTED: CD83 antigen isoform X2 [Cyprinodon variegatus]
MMTSHLLGLALLMSMMYLSSGRAVSQDTVEVSSVSGQDSTLMCTAEHKPGVQYVAVRWYKLESYPSPQRSGLLTRNLPDGTTKLYKGVSRQVELQDGSRDIFLPNVTCSDGGVYLCYLAAPVGEQNREGEVLLTLTDCPAAPINAEDPLLADTVMVIFASALLVLALLISFISYRCLKNTIKERNQTIKKEILLDAPLKPLEKKDLMLIYTLGPKTSTMKHVCV